MTAERMFESKLDFAAVHDSFWTHACDVDEMNRYIREEFVTLYKSDPLKQLLENLQQRFPHENFPPVPTKGDLDLEDINKSVYFFS